MLASHLVICLIVTLCFLSHINAADQDIFLDETFPAIRFKRNVYGIYQYLSNDKPNPKIGVKTKKFARLPILNMYRELYVTGENDQP